MTYQVNGTTVITSAQHVIVGSGTTRPASPATGTIWFNTSTGVLEGYNGTAWVTLSTA